MKELFAIASVLLLAIQSCNSLPFSRAGERPTVTVNEGIINGLYETQHGIDMATFRGIPFAQPPVDELRFMAPLPVQPWSFELDASILPPVCPQELDGKEDCLFLNVYAPANFTGLLPVMVFIHGGGVTPYTGGSAGNHDQPYPLVQHEVILVIIQYRLGVLGFLSTDDNVMPGNQGLQDQTLALKWIKDNIASFGGDSDSITLFGQSAGSSSAHFQVITTYATGLFNRYILMSGTALMPWTVARDYYAVSRDIARRNNCPENPSSDLLLCLQAVKNYIALNALQFLYADWNLLPYRFGPRVDGDYILADPAELVKNGQFTKLTGMMGVVKDEAAQSTGELYAKPAILNTLINNFEENGQPSLTLFDDEDPLNTAYTTYDYYVGGIDIDDSDADNLTKQYTDRNIHVPFDWSVQRIADIVDTFTYQFNYRGTWGITDFYAKHGLNITSAQNWIALGDDLQYIFNSRDMTDPTDLLIRCLYSTYFTNFAKYGDPTPGSDNFCVDPSVFAKWDKADGANLNHMSITPQPTMALDSRQDVRTFWENLPLRINAILQN